MNNIHLVKKENSSDFNVHWSNNKNIGSFIQLEDGFYYYKEKVNNGVLSAEALIEIGTKLQELNKDWDNLLSIEFNKKYQEESDNYNEF